VSGHEWFSGGGVSRFVRDVMLLWIGLDLLAMGVRYMASKPYSARLESIFVWLVIYGVAYLFRRRAAPQSVRQP
jgi:hypothetical protein